ncbi:MAG: VWA domain-containing protein, partial [Planctomycetia bacterium]|nr:VWA domain-containing protein [Planctomycetia bacterium]
RGAVARADDAGRAAGERWRRGLASADAGERVRTLRDLGAASKADVAAAGDLLGPLREILRRRDGAERALVASVVLRCPGDDALEAWARLLDPAREDDDRVHAAAVAAVDARAADPAVARRLVEVVRDPKAAPEARALALEALGGVEGPVADLLLRDARPGATWVEEACRALGLGRRGGAGVVAPLIALLGHDAAAVRVHAWEALVRVTRHDEPPDRAAWERWWRGQGGKLPAPAARRVEGAPVAGDAADAAYAAPTRSFVPTYYGIPLRGKTWGVNVVFCLDVSASMSEHGIEPARKHLKDALLALTTQDRFDVIGFNENVLPWAGRPVRGHPVPQARAVAWLDAIVPRSFTNLYDAVEAAFEYAGRGRHPSDAPIRLDAVFVLSDGAPNRGRYHLPSQLVDGIAALSQKSVPVHTIGAGEQVMALLRRIAEATGGTCTEATD